MQSSCVLPGTLFCYAANLLHSASFPASTADAGADYASYLDENTEYDLVQTAANMSSFLGNWLTQGSCVLPGKYLILLLLLISGMLLQLLPPAADGGADYASYLDEDTEYDLVQTAANMIYVSANGLRKAAVSCPAST
jgi:hypothetical protein